MRSYGRRRTSRRSNRKRGPRRLRRNYRIARPVITPKPAFIKRKFYFQNWTPSVVATTDFWKSFSFTLTNMYNSSDVTNLFDQYKINGIRVEMHPRYDSFAGNDTVDTTLPGITNQGGNQVHINFDTYNDVAPTGVYNTATLNFFLEKGGLVKTYAGHKPIKFYFKPTIEQNVGTVNTGRRIRAPYVSTTQAGLPHFGFSAFISDPNMTGNFSQSYDIFLTYYLTCKGLR